MRLTPKQRRAILDKTETVFQKLKARLLGYMFIGSVAYLDLVRQADPLKTLDGIFRYSNHMIYGPNASIDDHELKSLAEITSNYIEAKRLQTQNKIMAAAAQAETPKQVLAAIKEHLGSATEYMENLVSNEVRTVQSYADRSGIIQAAAILGIDDPTVVKFGRLDDKTCDVCRKLWHDPINPLKPVPYKMSQLKDGYMTDHKNPFATIGPSHPNCRHILSYTPPNTGFNSDGTMEVKGYGYDYYSDYHSNKKKS